MKEAKVWTNLYCSQCICSFDLFYENSDTNLKIGYKNYSSFSTFVERKQEPVYIRISRFKQQLLYSVSCTNKLF